MTTHHMCLSVRGALMNWHRGSHHGFQHDDGSPMTNAEAKAALLEELARGHEVIPFGQCDDFDYKSGCRGHVAAPSTLGRADSVAEARAPQGASGPEEKP